MNPESSGRAFGSLVRNHGRWPRRVRRCHRPADRHSFLQALCRRSFPHHRRIAALRRQGGRGLDRCARRCWNRRRRLHKSWWHDFWNRAALIKITSKDGSGEYMENLRNIYLYVAAVEKGDEYPGTQAGVADMISAADGTTHQWDPSAFWHWNLRMQVAANIGAGAGGTECTVFQSLPGEPGEYRGTGPRRHMKGRPGVCMPETMRFNGRGIEYESRWDTITQLWA